MYNWPTVLFICYILFIEERNTVFSYITCVCSLKVNLIGGSHPYSYILFNQLLGVLFSKSLATLTKLYNVI